MRKINLLTMGIETERADEIYIEAGAEVLNKF